MTRKLRILKHFCNTRKSGLKKDDECDFGEVLFRPYLVLSQSTSGVTPVYFQPTLGGSTTLRGFDDYHFRTPDAAMVSVDYRIPVYDPIGAVMFYDAGKVGNSIGDLSFSDARQDAGVGAPLLLQRTVAAEIYVAWGVGRGVWRDRRHSQSTLPENRDLEPAPQCSRLAPNASSRAASRTSVNSFSHSNHGVRYKLRYN